jgi:hypothetical protein
MHWRFLALAVLIFLVAAPAKSFGAIYYLDGANGSDSDSGQSESEAFGTMAALDSVSLAPGDSVLFRRGQSFDGVLDIGASGSSSSPITFGAWGTGAAPVLFEIAIGSDYVVIEDLIIDHQKADSDAIRIRGGQHCVIRNAEIRNGTRDGIDADAADGLLVEDVEIHHFLNGFFGSEDDGHGVAVTNTVGITVRRANIHHVSGDSFQSDPNRSPGNISDNIVIEDSILWTAPLSEDFNAGWSAGDSPGENAVDTKVLSSGYENEIRMDISLLNVTAFGWTTVPEMSNRAAFNLKEKINAVVDRVTVYDSEIAFRIRGGSGNADTLITNTVIYDVQTAVRAEDDLTNLRIYNTTFGNGITQQLQYAGGDAGAGTWDWRNNAFIGGKPDEAADDSNIVAAADDFVASKFRDYRLVADSSLVDAGVTLTAVTVDRDGRARTAPYDSGAYEFSAESDMARPKPPTNLTAE